MQRAVPVERYFMEKSRRKKPGNVKVMENYLRTDVHCVLEDCRLCRSISPPIVCLNPRSTVFIPDAVFLVAYIDLFSDDSFKADQTLLLQSVLDLAGDEVGTREASQIEAWLAREDDHALLKSFGYFPNKHMADTYVPTQVFEPSDDASSNEPRGLDVESMEQRARCLVANAVAWYSTHSPTTKFVVLSDDPCLASMIPPSSRHVDVLSCADFIDAYCPSTAHVDLHAVRADCAAAFSSRRASPQGFARHESDPSSCAFQGLLDVSSHHPLEAFVKVTTHGESQSIYIYGRDAMNRAIHGDIVAVQLLPEADWLVPESATSLVHHVAPLDDDQLKKKPAPSSTSSSVAAVPTGRVVGIVSRPDHVFVATILSTSVSPGDDYALAVPMDIRIPKIRLRSQNAIALVDQRLTVVVDTWAIDSTYPSGHYVQILGPVGDLDTEIQALLVQHAVHAHPFSEPALACLPDVRDVSVDVLAACDTTKRPHIPLTNGCQDIDDAMSISRLPNGHLQLGVHIADVGYFVSPDSALDLEAQNRATTVYLVDRRYDMLPVLLSGDLCSIHCGRDRLAFSVFWELDPATLEIVPTATTFAKSILHSAAAMTYYQADRLMDGLAADDPAAVNSVGTGTAGQAIAAALQPALREDLLMLREIGRALYRKRAASGAVDLSSGGELKERGGGLTVTTKAALEIHSTIAELMILANSTVAERLVAAFPQSAMLRRHVPPSGNRFDQLVGLASSQGLVLDTSTNMTLQRSLDAVQVDDDTMALLKSMATRAMSEAEYICASEATGHRLRFGHYGLGLEFYTHFTSPIRRYADIVVHRQLQATLLDKYPPHPPIISTFLKRGPQAALPASRVPSNTVAMLATDRLVPLSQHMNRQNRHAKRVSRACNDLFLALYFKSHVSSVHAAVVTSVKQNGLLVYLPEFDVRAPVYLKDRDGDVHLHTAMVPRAWHPALRPAKYAFAALSDMAMLPSATLALAPDSSRLSIIAPDTHTTISTFVPLQEIQVHVSCDFSSASVRVPQLRLLLVAPHKGRKDSGSSAKTAVHLEHDKGDVAELTTAVDSLTLESRRQPVTPPPS
ncbi:hypothetical protein DYB31_006972, partial [Aphanomyces astaci]